MAPPVIPVFTSREPGPPDPRRKLYVMAAALAAIILIAAVLAAVQVLGPSLSERCSATGGRWDEGLRQCEGGEPAPLPSSGY